MPVIKQDDNVNSLGDDAFRGLKALYAYLEQISGELNSANSKIENLNKYVKKLENELNYANTEFVKCRIESDSRGHRLETMRKLQEDQYSTLSQQILKGGW